MTRENGFYRVKLKTMLFPNGWQIAYWFQHHWMLIGNDDLISDEDLSEIEDSEIDPEP